MPLLRLAFAAFASTVVLNSAPIHAQSQSNTKSVQRYFTFSLSVADSIRDSEHTRGIFEGVVGLKLRQQSTVGVIVAAFGGIAFTPPFFGSDLLCPLEAGGGCRPMLEGLSFYGLQLGGQLRHEDLSLEISSGPALTHFGARNNSSGRPRPAVDALSVHTRVEGVVMLGNRIGLALTGSWRHVPKYDGSSLSANSLGVGLRIQ